MPPRPQRNRVEINEIVNQPAPPVPNMEDVRYQNEENNGVAQQANFNTVNNQNQNVNNNVNQQNRSIVHEWPNTKKKFTRSTEDYNIFMHLNEF
jgi:hypothetical protein